MLSFARNTTYEVEIAGPPREVRAFAQALEAAGEGIRVSLCQNDQRGAVAYFPMESRLIPILPAVGSRWDSTADQADLDLDLEAEEQAFQEQAFQDYCENEDRRRAAQRGVL